MIIAQAPLRMSFLGGGSDFSQHFSMHGGAVLATAIDKYAYTTLQPFNQRFFDHKLRVSYRITECADASDNIRHPAIRACLEKLDIRDGIELHHMADLPARSGLGSSSSFVVSMLQALHAYLGRFRSARDLACEAIEVERVILKEPGGLQDQIIAAFGGTCLIRFHGQSDFTVSQVPMSRAKIAEIHRNLLLFYTGILRDDFAPSHKLAQNASSRTKDLCSLADMAVSGADMLSNGEAIQRFAQLMDRSWKVKQDLSEVSLPAIDDAYRAAMTAGAWGGKLLGAGLGGFLLLFADPSRHSAISEALSPMHAVNVSIGAPGSRIIYAQD